MSNRMNNPQLLQVLHFNSQFSQALEGLRKSVDCVVLAICNNSADPTLLSVTKSCLSNMLYGVQLEQRKMSEILQSALSQSSRIEGSLRADVERELSNGAKQLQNCISNLLNPHQRNSSSHEMDAIPAAHFKHDDDVWDFDEDADYQPMSPSKVHSSQIYTSQVIPRPVYKPQPRAVPQSNPGASTPTAVPTQNAGVGQNQHSPVRNPTDPMSASPPANNQQPAATPGNPATSRPSGGLLQKYALAFPQSSDQEAVSIPEYRIHERSTQQLAANKREPVTTTLKNHFSTGDNLLVQLDRGADQLDPLVAQLNDSSIEWIGQTESPDGHPNHWRQMAIDIRKSGKSVVSVKVISATHWLLFTSDFLFEATFDPATQQTTITKIETPKKIACSDVLKPNGLGKPYFQFPGDPGIYFLTLADSKGMDKEFSLMYLEGSTLQHVAHLQGDKSMPIRSLINLRMEGRILTNENNLLQLGVVIRAQKEDGYKFYISWIFKVDRTTMEKPKYPGTVVINKTNNLKSLEMVDFKLLGERLLGLVLKDSTANLGSEWTIAVFRIPDKSGNTEGQMGADTVHEYTIKCPTNSRLLGGWGTSTQADYYIAWVTPKELQFGHFSNQQLNNGEIKLVWGRSQPIPQQPDSTLVAAEFLKKPANTSLGSVIRLLTTTDKYVSFKTTDLELCV